MKSPKLLKLPDLKTYLQQHATQNPAQPHLWEVHTDLPVFKKLYGYIGRRRRDVIANLIIPKGATMRALNAWGPRDKHPRKMRATEAVVHSMALRDGQPVLKAYSRHPGTGVIYRPGRTVKPILSFDMKDVACTSGIHFFLELRRAIQFPK